MPKIPFGPNHTEMLYPETIDKKVREKALGAKDNELDPINLFNITWKDEHAILGPSTGNFGIGVDILGKLVTYLLVWLNICFLIA